MYQCARLSYFDGRPEVMDAYIPHLQSLLGLSPKPVHCDIQFWLGMLYHKRGYVLLATRTLQVAIPLLQAIGSEKQSSKVARAHTIVTATSNIEQEVQRIYDFAASIWKSSSQSQQGIAPAMTELQSALYSAPWKIFGSWKGGQTARQLESQDPYLGKLAHGRLLLAQGNVAESERIWQSLVSSFPRRLECSVELWRLHTIQGAHKKAILDVRRAVELVTSGLSEWGKHIAVGADVILDDKFWACAGHEGIDLATVVHLLLAKSLKRCRLWDLAWQALQAGLDLCTIQSRGVFAFQFGKLCVVQLTSWFDLSMPRDGSTCPKKPPHWWFTQGSRMLLEAQGYECTEADRRKVAKYQSQLLELGKRMDEEVKTFQEGVVLDVLPSSNGVVEAGLEDDLKHFQPVESGCTDCAVEDAQGTHQSAVAEVDALSSGPSSTDVGEPAGTSDSDRVRNLNGVLSQAELTGTVQGGATGRSGLGVASKDPDTRHALIGSSEDELSGVPTDIQPSSGVAAFGLEDEADLCQPMEISHAELTILGDARETHQSGMVATRSFRSDSRMNATGLRVVGEASTANSDAQSLLGDMFIEAAGNAAVEETQQPSDSFGDLGEPSSSMHVSEPLRDPLQSFCQDGSAELTHCVMPGASY